MPGSDAVLTCSAPSKRTSSYASSEINQSPRSRADGGDGLDVFSRQHAAGRVVRRVDVDRPRPRRDRGFELRQVVAPAEILVQPARHRRAARRLDVAHARRPFRIRNDHLVAGFEERLADEKRPWIPPVVTITRRATAPGSDSVAAVSRRADRAAVARRSSAGSGCGSSSMAACIARFTVSGASKLTSPWSRRNGSLTEYIMSRIRMMPEKGTESRSLPTFRV